MIAAVTLKRIPEQQFACMQTDWNALLDESGNGNFFLTWQWLYTYWTAVKTAKHELVLLGGYQDKRLVALAPFYASPSSMFRIPTKSLFFLGHSVAADFLDIFGLKDTLDSFGESLWSYVNNDFFSAGYFFMGHLLPDSRWGRLLQRSPGYTEISRMPAPSIQLPETSSAFLARLSSSARYRIKRKLKRWENQFGPADCTGEPIANNLQTLETLFALHHSRWRLNKKVSTFDTPFRKKFCKLLAENSIKKDGSFFVLRAEGKPVSVCYVFRRKETWYFYQNGWDSACAQYSPGIVNLFYAIESVIEKGAKRFELLRGAEDYKKLFSNEEQQLLHLLVTPASKIGAVAGTLIKAKAFAKCRMMPKART